MLCRSEAESSKASKQDAWRTCQLALRWHALRLLVLRYGSLMAMRVNVCERLLAHCRFLALSYIKYNSALAALAAVYPHGCVAAEGGFFYFFCYLKYYFYYCLKLITYVLFMLIFGCRNYWFICFFDI